MVLCALCAWGAGASELSGVSFPDQVVVEGRTLVLNGMGLREATVLMVDVYVAGLYLETKSTDPAVILRVDQPKRIVLKFVRSIGKEKLVETWTEGFDRNAGDRRTALAPELAALNAAMTDVKKDDAITLTYLPDRGVGVAVGGKEAAVIPGDEFQRVLFSIWLGAKPPNVSLREGLLGREPSD